MKLAKWVVVTSIISILCSCSATYKVTRISDRFDGYTIDRMEGNKLPGAGLFGNVIELNCQRVLYRAGSSVYSLIVVYQGNDVDLSALGVYQGADWMFIESGESLIFLVDGIRMGLTGDGSSSHRDVVYKGVEEKAWYRISRAQLEQIAAARTVYAKVIGSKFYEERKLSSKNLDNIRRFLEEH